MGRFVDLSGRTFGFLTVLSRAENRGRTTRFHCVCSCISQTSIVVHSENLVKGHTKSCGYVWERATAVFFFKGRLFFHYPDGRRAAANAGAPSCLVAYGERDAARLGMYRRPGKFLSLGENNR